MKPGTSAEKLKRRYRRLAAKLGGTGLLLQGTITVRTMGKDKNPSRPGEKINGPYYQWTFKREGKTVTVNLAAQPAKLYQTAIDHNRELEKTLKEMRTLSEQILEAETEGVKRRKAGKEGKMSLS